MRDTLLIVGNGLALDYRTHAPSMPNPSLPLDYPLSKPGGGGQPLRETFSVLWNVIDHFRASEPGINDFELIKQIRQLPRDSLDDGPTSTQAWFDQRQKQHIGELTEGQLRLHLTHAYTHFTKMIDEAELRTWRWSAWMRANHARLHTVVSFNYDLLLERALRDVVPVRYLNLVQGGGIFGVNREVLVFKPHGSINFTFVDNFVRFPDNFDFYAAKGVIRRVNAPIRELSDGELDRQRVNSDIVLPTEASFIRRFQYITPGYCYLKSTRRDISRCVIVGTSYWDCDRPEIDEILGNLRRDVRVVICNPNPPEGLKNRWAGHFARFETVTAGVPSDMR